MSILQRITDLWPSLLRSGQEEPSELEEPLLGSHDDVPEARRPQEVDERQLLEDYKHLYWSRLIRVANFEAGQERKWPLGPDIIEECEAVAAIPGDGPAGWRARFDPVEFNEVHGPLELE